MMDRAMSVGYVQRNNGETKSESIGNSVLPHSVLQFFERYGKTYLFSLLVTLLCWGGNALTSNVRVDMEHFVNNPGTMQGWLTIGRWGQLGLKALIGNIDFNPYYAGVLFLIIWPLSAMAWLFLFEYCRGRQLKGRWIFILTYSVAHWWSYIFYFSMMAVEVSIGLFIIPIAILLMLGIFQQTAILKKVGLALGSVVLLVSVYALYQALVPATITGMAAALFFLSVRQLHERGSFWDYLKRCLLSLSVFLISYVVYSVITALYFTSSDYLSSQVVWDERGFASCAYDLLRYAWHVITCRTEGATGLFSLGVISSMVIYGILFFRSSTRRSATWQLRALSVITFFVLLISPFLLAIYMGQAPIARSQFSIPIAASVLTLFAFDEISDNSNKCYALPFSVVIVALTVVFSVYSISLIQRDVYTDDVRYQQEAAFANNLLVDLERLYGEQLNEVPVVFVGKWSAPLNPACTRDEIWGRTLFEHDYMYLENAAYNTVRIAGFIQAVFGVRLVSPSADQEQIAVVIASGMESYPDAESICMKDGIIVVKLDN